MIWVIQNFFPIHLLCGIKLENNESLKNYLTNIYAISRSGSSCRFYVRTAIAVEKEEIN